MSNAEMIMHPRYTTMPINVAMPEKMELRVVEYTKGDRNVKTVLEYRMHHFDHNGAMVSITNWAEVERVRIEMGDI